MHDQPQHKEKIRLEILEKVRLKLPALEQKRRKLAETHFWKTIQGVVIMLVVIVLLIRSVGAWHLLSTGGALVFIAITLVFPDFAQQTFGMWLGKKMQAKGHNGLELVYLEDQQFEKDYVVYSTDQIEARYILTPAMVEGLVALNQKYYRRLSFSFTQGVVCIAIADLPAFEAFLNSPISAEDLLDDFNRPIDMVKDIIDTLRLNTRIWGKGN
ncbi:MAG: DUF3137 domain-containing protein [Saprospiraceae bacterium]